jgi:predicted metal-binding membrane protein
MATTSGSPLTRERYLILALLLVLAAAAWALLIGQAGMAGEMGMGLTMGMAVPVFLGIWVAMMVAMMFPTAAPMILVFARVNATRRERGSAFVPTWIFVAAYLLIWIAFGAVAYVLATAAEGLAASSMWLMENGPRIGGVVLVLAGLYQLSPLKRVCLSKCRSPMQFIMTGWREGRGGAFRMGLEHGLYCLGCCWLLFVILFPLGMMNVAAMALITVLIFAEKSLPLGRQVGLAAAGLLIAYGLLVVLVPGALPTTMAASAATPTA